MDSTADVISITIQGIAAKYALRIHDTPGCKWVVKEIFERKDYPIIPFAGDPGVIVDIGANVGISAGYFRANYPEAKLVCFEPDPDAFALLTVNAAELGNCDIHNFGLSNADGSTHFYRGKDSSTHSSVHSSNRADDQKIEIVLKNAGPFLDSLKIGAIDLLKIDTEGCEVEILLSLRHRAREAKVVYLEVHSESTRRVVDEMLSVTHILWAGQVEMAHRAQLTYVRRDLLPDPLPVAALDGL